MGLIILVIPFTFFALKGLKYLLLLGASLEEQIKVSSLNVVI